MHLILSSFNLLALAFYHGVFWVPDTTQASASVTFSIAHLPSKCHGQEQSQCRKVHSKTWMQKGASKLGQLLQKSSTSVFLLPFRSALLWYVLLAFDLELQNSSSRTCSFFLSKYALCPISYHTNYRCDLSEFIKNKALVKFASFTKWLTDINNFLISPCSFVILAASPWKGHSYQTLEVIMTKVSSTSD